MRLTSDELELLMETTCQKPVERNRIAEYVDSVYSNIKLYNTDNDFLVLTKISCLCSSNNMPLESAKMDRNIGMYYFYKNKPVKALEYLSLAAEYFKTHRKYDLLIQCLSDMGLVYFYDYQYEESDSTYKRAEGFIPRLKHAEPGILFLLYYRMGILYTYMKKYQEAYDLLGKSFGYASNPKEQGSSVMNMGIVHVKQGNYDEGLKCYERALNEIYLETQTIEKSSIFNNMAEVYKCKGEYDKALEYINLAFEYLGCKNMEKFFIFFQTYTEIKILQGESKILLTKLVELLSRVKDFFLYKCFIIDGINVAVNTGRSDKKTLINLEHELSELIEEAGRQSKEYKKELMGYLSDVCLSLKVLGSD